MTLLRNAVLCLALSAVENVEAMMSVDEDDDLATSIAKTQVIGDKSLSASDMECLPKLPAQENVIYPEQKSSTLAELIDPEPNSLSKLAVYDEVLQIFNNNKTSTDSFFSAIREYAPDESELLAIQMLPLLAVWDEDDNDLSRAVRGLSKLKSNDRVLFVYKVKPLISRTRGSYFKNFAIWGLSCIADRHKEGLCVVDQALMFFQEYTDLVGVIGILHIFSSLREEDRNDYLNYVKDLRKFHKVEEYGLVVLAEDFIKLNKGKKCLEDLIPRLMRLGVTLSDAVFELGLFGELSPQLVRQLEQLIRPCMNSKTVKRILKDIWNIGTNDLMRMIMSIDLNQFFTPDMDDNDVASIVENLFTLREASFFYKNAKDFGIDECKMRKCDRASFIARSALLLHGNATARGYILSCMHNDNYYGPHENGDHYVVFGLLFMEDMLRNNKDATAGLGHWVKNDAEKNLLSSYINGESNPNWIRQIDQIHFYLQPLVDPLYTLHYPATANDFYAQLFAYHQQLTRGEVPQFKDQNILLDPSEMIYYLRMMSPFVYDADGQLIIAAEENPRESLVAALYGDTYTPEGGGFSVDDFVGRHFMKQSA